MGIKKSKTNFLGANTKRQKRQKHLAGMEQVFENMWREEIKRELILKDYLKKRFKTTQVYKFFFL